MLAVAVIINNYLHDFASALLLASALLVWVAGRAVSGGASSEAFLAAYPKLTRIAWGALAAIIVLGVPRVIFFSRFEWDPAVVKGIVPALIIKHVIMFAAVGGGAALWVTTARKVRSAE
jgi:hypothetical protein